MTAMVRKTQNEAAIKESIIQEAMISCEPRKFFTPGRNVEQTKQKLRDARPHFRIRNAVNKVVSFMVGFGGLSGSWFASGALVNNGGMWEETAGLIVAVIGTFGFPVLGLIKLVSGPEGKLILVDDELKKSNLQAFNKWIRARYGIDVIYRHSSYSNQTIQYDVSKAVSYGIENTSDSIDFRGDDNNWYVLESDENGDLFVRRRNEGEAKTVFDGPSAITSKPLVIAPVANPKVISKTDSLLAQIKALAGKLSGFDLTVEQKHVVGRSVAEAEEAVGLLAKMRMLRDTASDVDTIHILNACLKDVKRVTEDVYSGLTDKVAVNTTVVSMRDESSALLR